MDEDKAIEMFECMSNLDSSRLLSYLCKHSMEIGEASKVALKAIKTKKRLKEFLKILERDVI